MKLSLCLFGATLIFAPAAWASTPADSIQDAIQRDNSDIVLSREAQLRAGMPATSQYAQQAERVHRVARARLARLGVETAGEITPEAQRELDLLSMLVGHEFDAEYLRYMAQDQAIQAHELQDAQAEGGGLREVAEAQAPVLEKGAQRAKILEYRAEDAPHA